MQSFDRRMPKSGEGRKALVCSHRPVGGLSHFSITTIDDGAQRPGYKAYLTVVRAGRYSRE